VLKAKRHRLGIKQGHEVLFYKIRHELEQIRNLWLMKLQMP